jgi:hypothetical protein
LIDGLEIQYLNNLVGCRHVFRLKTGFEMPVIPTAPVSATKGIISILPRKKAGMLEYLYKILMEVETQIGFVPCHLLVRLTPFKILDNKNQSFAYYSNYTLNTNNNEVLNFFESINFKQTPRFKKNAQYENTDENLKKLDYVIKRLNQNLIYHVSEQTSSRSIDIRPEKKELPCDCLLCCYERMDLVLVIERLKHAENENAYDAAFVSSLLECNEIASSITIGLVESALQNKKILLYYRLLFHIRWLEQITYTRQGIVDHTRLQEWKAVDSNAVYANLLEEGGFWKDCADYFYNQYFEGDHVKDIYEIVHDIREHHSMQLRGGISNNSNLYNLSSRFNEFELFLKGNRMPFFRFSNFSKVFDQYTESLFLSLALNEYQSSRLENFNDLIIRQLFHYGNPDVIIKMSNRYARNGITYISDDPARSAIDMIRNFLRDLPIILGMPVETLPENSNFRYLINKMRTLLVILSIVKFDKNFIRESASMLLFYFESQKEKSFRPPNELSSFLSTKLCILEKREQKKWLLLCINSEPYQDGELLYSFSAENLKGVRLLTASKDFDLLKQNIFPKLIKPYSHYSGPVINLYGTMSELNREKMRVFIESILNSEFDFPVFYNAAIYNVIDPENRLEQYTANFISMQIPTKHDRPFFLESEIFIRALNDLINLYFSLDKVLPQALVLHFKGISLYYDWLLDMQNFDYQNFKPIWVSLYPTCHYLKQIFSVTQVCTAVKDWLKKNPHEMIANYYIMHSLQNK